MLLSPSILTSNTIVIGFAGRSGHGKNAAASAIIARNSSRGIKSYGFADELKVEVFDALLDPNNPYWASVSGSIVAALPRPSEMYVGRALKIAWVDAHKEQFGNVLQHYGTEYRRAQDPFYWMNKLRAKLEEDRPGFALITDVRFGNELYFIRACCGYMVKVERIGYQSATRDASHVSESGIDGLRCDFEIRVNDGDLDQLRYEAVRVFDAIIEDQQPVSTELHAVQGN